MTQIINTTGAVEVYKIRNLYGVSRVTWFTWIEKIPNLGVTKGARKYTPKQVQLIKDHLGEPGA